MHKALHLRDDVERMYVSRKEGGRGLISTQDSVDASRHRLEDYIKKRGGRLIAVTRNDTNNTNINRTKITRKQKIGRKTTAWTFQETNKRNLTQENLDIAKKGKP